MSEHRATIDWRLGDASFTYETYSRSHVLRFGGGPVVLEVANHGERVAGVADRRKPKDADVFGRRVCEQVRQVDNEGRTR